MMQHTRTQEIKMSSSEFGIYNLSKFIIELQISWETTEEFKLELFFYEDSFSKLVFVTCKGTDKVSRF
jgi:hypothetical protein